MSVGLLYLISILDSLSVFFLLSMLVCGCACFVFYIISENNIQSENYARAKFRVSCIFGIFCIISGILNAAIPSKHDAMFIYALPKIANNKQLQEIPPKILQSVNDTIDSYDQYIKHKLADNKGNSK